LWVVSYWTAVWRKKPSPAPGAVPLPFSRLARPFSAFPSAPLAPLAAGLIAWILFVEAGVASWYFICDSHIPPGPKWSLVLPENNPTFQSLPVTPAERELLRFDDGAQGQWQQNDGSVWRAFYFDWAPGRVAGYLAKRHTPDICLPATGMTMLSGPVLTLLHVHDLVLPMRSYVFDGPDGTVQVFQCHWQPGENDQAYAYESSRWNLVRSIWAGRGDKGQKVLEFVLSGYDNTESAKEALTKELKQLIKVERS